MCESCEICRQHDQSRLVEPSVMDFTKMESHAMERVGCDLFHYASDAWLVMTDYYSGYLMVKKLGRKSSTVKVIKTLSKWFQCFDYPRFARFNSGPEFRGKFQDWLVEVGVTAELSSAYFSQSNGRTEHGSRFVRSCWQKHPTSQ